MIRLYFLWLAALAAAAPAWAYQLDLNEANTSIHFELNSTWHTIHGEAPGFIGTLTTDDPLNPTTVSGEIVIRAAEMDTGGERRDRKMRAYSMEVESHPVITYRITGFDGSRLLGELTIKNVTRPVNLALVKEMKQGAVEWTGETVVHWPDFNVSDPSIIIAKVHKDVTITVRARLPLE